MKKTGLLLIMVFFVVPFVQADEYLGEYGGSRYDPNSAHNPYGQYGSPYSSPSVNNPYGEYGSPYSPKSTRNPYATEAPRLYDSRGNYRGRLSNNPYDSDSISNPYGEYGNPYSSESPANPYNTETFTIIGE